ncbi:hypothetical protein GCM10007421_24840 [Halopseudomonas oceani]|uniref:Protein TonB n=1 Tax=Halopseudomonas oceani TaxID=1708783 RepID=A0A2P4EUR3_9GAMM|nr:energy transducer TonB [Halopseudomonas oceani]POB03209.1 energy transducer TonB [Halopseudomonas oceani]GGE49606.1 hypothetical protein GCM10007421_24840 [Halopseudomonas oceani]
MSAATPPLMLLQERSSVPSESNRGIAAPLLTTLALHAAVAGLLWAGWEPTRSPVPAEQTSIRTQLVTLPVPAPEPTVAPVTAPSPPAPEPPTPVVEAPPPKPVVDEAAIARKRLAERQEREQQQRREALEREQERAEQQRLAAQAAAEQQRLDELARQQAAADAAAAAAAERAAAQRQYLPLSKPEPDYPRRALTQRLEGDCTVEYDVNANGRVDNPRLVSGACDNPLFARPSLAAAKDFIYQPRLVNGQPVAVTGVRNTFRYRLSQ